MADRIQLLKWKQGVIREEAALGFEEKEKAIKPYISNDRSSIPRRRELILILALEDLSFLHQLWFWRDEIGVSVRVTVRVLGSAREKPVLGEVLQEFLFQ